MFIYGKNPIIERLKKHQSITNLFITDKNLEIVKPYLKQVSNVNIVSINELTKLYGDKTQGMVAEIKEYKYASVNEIVNLGKEKDNSTIVILDSLEDPHNLGAILRSSDATGVDGIIIGKNRSVSLTDTVAKVSTGAIEHVKVAQVTNLVNTMKDLKDLGYWIVGLELDGTIDYREQDYSGKIAVVIGSEGRGISKLVKDNCDFLVRIPMYGKVNSLNASVSAALLLYQILTNRGM